LSLWDKLYFLILIIRIYAYSIKKVALLFSAHGGRCLAENVAVGFPDNHKLRSDYGAYDKTNPPAARMIAAGRMTAAPE